MPGPGATSTASCRSAALPSATRKNQQSSRWLSKSDSVRSSIVLPASSKPTSDNSASDYARPARQAKGTPNGDLDSNQRLISRNPKITGQDPGDAEQELLAALQRLSHQYRGRRRGRSGDQREH